MKSLLFCIASLVCTIGSSSSAASTAFSLEVTVTPKNGEPISVSIPRLALESGNRVELSLPTQAGSLVAEFDFSLQNRIVLVKLFDPAQQEMTEKGLQRPMLVECYLSFELGENTPIVKTPLGDVSFMLTPPKGWEEREKKTKDERSSKISSSKPGHQKDAEIPEEALAGIEYQADFDPVTNQISLSAYNTTNYVVEKVTVRLTVSGSDGSKEVDRLYDFYNLKLFPKNDLSEGRYISFNPGIPEEAEISVTLESAMGRLID